MKSDERAFLEALRAEHQHVPYRRVGTPVPADEIGEEVGLSAKRVDYLLEKWTQRGWWEYGVSARTGWFTPQGIAVEAAKEAQA